MLKKRIKRKDGGPTPSKTPSPYAYDWGKASNSVPVSTYADRAKSTMEVTEKTGYVPFVSELAYQLVDAAGGDTGSKSVIPKAFYGVKRLLPGRAKKPKSGEEGYTVDEDFYKKYLGLPYNTSAVQDSPYKPSISKDPSAKYFRLSDEYINKQAILDHSLTNDPWPKELEGKSRVINNPDFYNYKTDENGVRTKIMDPLQNFTVSKGKDAQGEYLSIYDKWDLQSNPVEGVLGKPFEIYDRIYYDPTTKKVQPQNNMANNYQGGGQVVPTDTAGSILSTVTAAAPLLDLAIPGLGTGLSAVSGAASNWYNSINNPKANPLGANSRALGYKKGGKISKRKAREILHDGTVHGRPLTDKQRRFMGAMSHEMGGAIPLSSDAVQVQGNPNRTDNISTNVKGVPVKLDHDEVVIDQGDSAYVISNSIMDPMTGLPLAQSAAKVAAGKGKAESKLSHNPYDQEALNTVMLSDHLLGKYQQINEMQRTKSSTNSFAEGGNVDPDNIVTVFKEYLKDTKGVGQDTLSDPELFKEVSMKYVSEFIDSIVSEYSSPRTRSNQRIKMIADFSARATEEYNNLREGRVSNAYQEANQRATGRGMMLHTPTDDARVADINARIDSVSNAYREQQLMAEARTKSEHDTFMSQLRAEEQQRQQSAFKSGQEAADWLMSPFSNRGHDQSYVANKVGEPASSGSFNLMDAPNDANAYTPAGVRIAAPGNNTPKNISIDLPSIDSPNDPNAYTMAGIRIAAPGNNVPASKRTPPPVPHYNEDQFRQIAGIGARPTYEANPFVEEDKLAQMYPDLFRQTALSAPGSTISKPSTRRRAPRYVPGTQGFEVPVTGQTQQAYRDQQYTNERTAVPVEPLINEGKGLSVEGFQRYATSRDAKALPKYGVDNKWGRETAGAWSKYGDDYIRSRYHENNAALPMLPASQYPQERQVTSGIPTVKPMRTKDGKLRFATGGGVDPYYYGKVGEIPPYSQPRQRAAVSMPPVNQTGRYGPGVQIAPQGLGDATSTLAPWAYGPAKVPETYYSDFKGPYSIPTPQSPIPTVTQSDLNRVAGTGGSGRTKNAPAAAAPFDPASSIIPPTSDYSLPMNAPNRAQSKLGKAANFNFNPTGKTTATTNAVGNSTMGDALQLLEVGSKFMGLAQGPQYEQLNLAPTYQVDAQPYLNQIQQGYATQRQGINTGSYNVDKGARQAAYAGQYQATGNVLDDVHRTNIGLADQTSKFNLQQRSMTADLNSRNQGAYDQAVQNAFTTVGNTGRAYNQKEMGLQALDYLRTSYPDVFDYVVRSGAQQKTFKKGGKVKSSKKSC